MDPDAPLLLDWIVFGADIIESGLALLSGFITVNRLSPALIFSAGLRSVSGRLSLKGFGGDCRSHLSFLKIYLCSSDKWTDGAIDNQQFEWICLTIWNHHAGRVFNFQPSGSFFTGDFYSNEFQCLCETEQIKEALMCQTAACLSICNHQSDTNPHTVRLKSVEQRFSLPKLKSRSCWLLFSLFNLGEICTRTKGEHCWTEDTVQSVEELLLPKGV